MNNFLSILLISNILYYFFNFIMMKKGEKLIFSSEYLFYNPFLSPVILNIIHSSRPLCITFVKGFWARWEPFFLFFTVSKSNKELHYSKKHIPNKIHNKNNLDKNFRYKWSETTINILERVMIQHVSSNALR